MSDPVKLASHVPKVIVALADTDLSLVGMAATCRIAAEAFTQAQILAEITASIARRAAGK